MIKLTRLRQNTPFILNPDHIERIDTHVDTVVKLTSGNEYVVNETGEDIVRMTIEYRALVLASAGRLAVSDHVVPGTVPSEHAVEQEQPTAVEEAAEVIERDPGEPAEPAVDDDADAEVAS